MNPVKLSKVECLNSSDILSENEIPQLWDSDSDDSEDSESELFHLTNKSIVPCLKDNNIDSSDDENLSDDDIQEKQDLRQRPEEHHKFSKY